MPRPSFYLTPADVLLVLAAAIAFLWLRLRSVDVRGRGVDVRGRCADAALSVTGYLRPRPDPVAEAVLRAAFAELDSELAAILGDRRSAKSAVR
jgi:hypothetical protein